MNKKIRIEITPDGEIRAKTLGIKGEECLDYVDLMEYLTDAVSVDSKFTEEYYEVPVDLQERERLEIEEE